MRWLKVSNINVENEKDISVNLTCKANNLMIISGILFIGFALLLFLLYEVFYSIKLFVTIFSSILVGLIFLSILFSSLSNFISYNYRDNKDKLYKNNKARNLLLMLSYSFLWGFIGLSFIFLMILLILK